jgi:molybdenum cofactor synthesis domain-containing protein
VGGTRVETGQVIDCITPFLQATLVSRGCEPVLLASAGDSVTALRTSLDAALESESFDLIITVAGVSLGSADHTPAVLASLELDELFHGVAIRPGGPVMLSLHRASNTPVLSLPGNPMASAVCMQSFGAAILDGLSSRAGGEGWSELDLGPFSEEEVEQNASWQEWLERLKPGMSTFAALPVSDQGVPTLRGIFSAGRRTGPCALGSLIGAGAWIRADRAANGGGKDKVFWRPF